MKKHFDSNDNLHDKEESSDDDIGEVPRQEGEKERGQDAILRANTDHRDRDGQSYSNDHDLVVRRSVTRTL